MDEFDIFISVGAAATEQQEVFINAVEDRLRSEGLIPHTVGRNTFSADAPLKTVIELMEKCAGTVVIALERYYFPIGTEKRGGSREVPLAEIKLPTPWNQIEAAMAHSRGHPLLVIVESGIKNEGLLSRGYDWYVQSVVPEVSALHTAEFNGVLASWKQKLTQSPGTSPRDKADFTVAELLGGLKAHQLWSLLSALAALAAGSFALGSKFFGH